MLRIYHQLLLIELTFDIPVDVEGVIRELATITYITLIGYVIRYDINIAITGPVITIRCVITVNRYDMNFTIIMIGYTYYHVMVRLADCAVTMNIVVRDKLDSEHT